MSSKEIHYHGVTGDTISAAIRDDMFWIVALDAKTSEKATFFPTPEQEAQIFEKLKERIEGREAKAEAETVPEWPKYYLGKIGSLEFVWVATSERKILLWFADDFRRTWRLSCYSSICKMLEDRARPKELTPAKFAALGLLPPPEPSNG